MATDHLNLSISAIVQETPGTFSYYFRSATSVTYAAGQFLTLLLDVNGKEVRRSYSLGSTPGIDDEIFITVKRKTNGEVSRYIHDHFEHDQVIRSLAPAGLFTLNEHPAEQYLFFAAGSGIVPIFSLIKELLHHYPETVVTLVYQNNNENDVIYHAALKDLQQQFHTRFSIQWFFSSPIQDQAPVRLNNVLLEQLLPKLIHAKDVMFYTCGPEPFMRMVQFTLKLSGITDERIRKENFVIGTPVIPTDIDTSPKQVTIHYQGKEHQLEVKYPQTILSAALAQNIEIPYSCRGGRCSVCMAVCQGEVHMSINDVLTSREMNNGYILTCTAHPLTDCEISYP